MEYQFKTKLKCSMLSGLVWKVHKQQMALLSVWTAWCKEVKGSLWFLFIQILTHFCFCLIYFVVGFLGLFCSSQCLSPGFLFGCSLPCVGDELAQHDVRLRDVALSVSRSVRAKCCHVSKPAPCTGVSTGWVPGLTHSCPPCCHPATTSQRPAKAAKEEGREDGVVSLTVGNWDWL